jgi:hypothetical protein
MANRSQPRGPFDVWEVQRRVGIHSPDRERGLWGLRMSHPRSHGLFSKTDRSIGYPHGPIANEEISIDDALEYQKRERFPTMDNFLNEIA